MNRKKQLIISGLTWISILTIWTIVSILDIFPKTSLPSLVDVIKALVETIRNGYNYISLWNHLGISLFRLLVAIVLSILIGVPLGLWCGYHPYLKHIINPIINFYRPLPPLAYYTLLIIWLGIGEESKIMLLFLASLAPVFVSSMSSVSRVKENYILSAQSFGANPRQVFTKVILPAAMPEVFVGIRTAVGVAYTTLVSSEMIAATAGIGWMVIDAYKYLKTDVVFVGIILMGITGMLLDLILIRLEKRLFFWNGK